MSQKRSPGGGGLKSPISYYKSSTQHLSFLKEKLSTMIHALSLQDSGTAEHELGQPGGGSMAGGILSLGIGANWVDSLGLILGCGLDEKTEVRSHHHCLLHLCRSRVSLRSSPVSQLDSTMV
jgi:hypothetical protein